MMDAAAGAPLPIGRLRHLRRLTDDTGILEHALGVVPRRKEGYSTDDQARALWVCLEWLELVKQEHVQELYALIDRYLSFLLWVQKGNGHFHNNIAFDRTEEAEQPSDDCLGRCLWASALALVTLTDDARRLAAREVLGRALAPMRELRYPRGWAYAAASMSLLLRRLSAEERERLGTCAASGGGKPDAAAAPDLAGELDTLAGKLAEAYRQYRTPEWQWYEPLITYSSAVLPWGLLCAYEAGGNEQYLAIALESLDFLLQLSQNDAGYIRPVGNDGWCSDGHRALWDQQPIDVVKLLLACSSAYSATGERKYFEAAQRCRDWFYGANDAGIAIVDADEGSCCDGIGEHGPNENRGAESTIAYLLAEAVYWKLMNKRN